MDVPRETCCPEEGSHKEELVALRAELQAVLDRYPKQGAMIDYQRIKHIQNTGGKNNQGKGANRKKKKVQ